MWFLRLVVLKPLLWLFEHEGMGQSIAVGFFFLEGLWLWQVFFFDPPRSFSFPLSASFWVWDREKAVSAGRFFWGLEVWVFLLVLVVLDFVVGFDGEGGGPWFSTSIGCEVLELVLVDASVCGAGCAGLGGLGLLAVGLGLGLGCALRRVWLGSVPIGSCLCGT